MYTTIQDEYTDERIEQLTSRNTSDEEYYREEALYLADKGDRSNPNRAWLSWHDYLHQRTLQIQDSSSRERALRRPPMDAVQLEKLRRANGYYASHQPRFDASRLPRSQYYAPPLDAYSHYGPPSAYSTTSRADTEGRDPHQDHSSFDRVVGLNSRANTDNYTPPRSAYNHYYSTTSRANTEGRDSRQDRSSFHRSRHAYESNDRHEGSTHHHGGSRSRRDGRH